MPGQERLARAQARYLMQRRFRRTRSQLTARAAVYTSAVLQTSPDQRLHPGTTRLLGSFEDPLRG